MLNALDVLLDDDLDKDLHDGRGPWSFDKHLLILGVSKEGEALENNNNPWHPYLRIRVFIDVRKPLKRTKRIKKQGNEVVEVSFKFEHLGTFCYLCGLLGHSDDYCAKLLTLENDDGTRIWVRN
ncbi:hypothetical protein JHK85_045340 [Glycine max]|nr:hypothetical protein JHK85_045340 [Glycine max]